jgi:hypothetical protein
MFAYSNNVRLLLHTRWYISQSQVKGVSDLGGKALIIGKLV